MKCPEDLFGKEDGYLISTGNLVRSGICNTDFLSKIQKIHDRVRSSKEKEDNAVYGAVIRV
jgi:hypothetical protein